MEYGFSAANKALLAAGKLIQLATKDGKLLPMLADPANQNRIVEIAKGVAGTAPIVAVNPVAGLVMMVGNMAMNAAQMYQNHRGFQAVLRQLNLIQSSLRVLQATTAVIGVGVAAGAALSAVNLYQTLKLREDVKKLSLEVKDGFIDLKQVLKYQGTEIIQQIDRVAQDVEFSQHRTILAQGYGNFIEATQLIKNAISCDGISARNSTLETAKGMLAGALAAYNNPQLLSETCPAGLLRRMECAWAIEQTKAITFQLQDEPKAASHHLSFLQDKIRHDSLTVINRCKTEDELDFLFPELKRIHDSDLAALESWQAQIDWVRSLSPSELKMLQTADFINLEITEAPAVNALAVPPEQTFYESIKPKSHPDSLFDQLRFMMNRTLRREAELYISEQSQAVGYKRLVPTNLQEVSDLAVANLFWYFKLQDESEEGVPA